MGRDHEKRHTPGKINLLGPYVINFLRYRKRSFELRKTPECIWPLFTQSRTSSQSQGFIPLVRTLFKESTAHHPDIPKTWSFLSCIFAELGLTPRQEFMQFVFCEFYSDQILSALQIPQVFRCPSCMKVRCGVTGNEFWACFRNVRKLIGIVFFNSDSFKTTPLIRG